MQTQRNTKWIGIQRLWSIASRLSQGRSGRLKDRSLSSCGVRLLSCLKNEADFVAFAEGNAIARTQSVAVAHG
jgi:hypothetical protein